MSKREMKLAAALREASVYGIGATSDANQKVILQAATEFAALPAVQEVADPIVTFTVCIDGAGNVHNRTQTHGNSFARVYRAFHEIRAEVDRQIAERRNCPFNPAYGPDDPETALTALDASASPAVQERRVPEGCILCANGNDLPEGETCAGCGREGLAFGLRAAVIKARGRQVPPSTPVAFDGPSPPAPAPEGEWREIVKEIADYVERHSDTPAKNVADSIRKTWLPAPPIVAEAKG